jgi:glycosyltransferase involved in cell wall biosynthesis
MSDGGIAGEAAVPRPGRDRARTALRGGRRVLHLVSSLRRGGMETMVLRLAEQQRRRGHDAAVLAMWGGPLLEEARALDVPAYVVERGGRLARAARTAAFLVDLAPEILHAHNPTTLRIAALARVLTERLAALRGDGARCGLLMTDHQSRDAREPWGFEWRRTDVVVAVSRHTAAAGSAAQRARALRVIRNGVALPVGGRSRAAVRAELGLGDELTCITVANLRPEKDLATLLRAHAQLAQEGVRAVALLVGEGPDRAALEAEARALGLGADRLRFLGARTDVPDLLRAADVFVLSSRTEGLPLAVLEAMAASLPIVSTAVGGVPEVVAHGEHGLLVAPGSPAALAGALESLAYDPERRLDLGARAFARARDTCSLDAMARAYDALYEELHAPLG